MKTQEVAEQSGISMHTLRYYEKERLLPAVHRQGNGHRDYTEEDLERLVFITRMRSSGMHIRDIRRFMQLVDGGAATLLERIGIMEQHQLAVERRMAEMEEAYRIIQHKVAHYKGLLAQGEEPGGEGC